MSLQAVGPGLWTVSVPHRMLGLHLGTRMNVVELEGGLLLHSPVPPEPLLVDSVRTLGPVRHIVAPNYHHHLHVEPWRALFPEARLHLAQKLDTKRPDLQGVPLGSESFGPDLLHRPIAGTEGRLSENVFVHTPSSSLLVSDLISNLPPARHPWTKLYGSIMGFDGRPGLSRVLRTAFHDRAAARRSIDEVLTLPWTRIVMAHGAILEHDAKEILRATYAWL